MLLVGLKILLSSLSKLKLQIYNPFALYVAALSMLHVHGFCSVLFISSVKILFLLFSAY